MVLYFSTGFVLSVWRIIIILFTLSSWSLPLPLLSLWPLEAMPGLPSTWRLVSNPKQHTKKIDSSVGTDRAALAKSGVLRILASCHDISRHVFLPMKTCLAFATKSQEVLPRIVVESFGMTTSLDQVSHAIILISFSSAYYCRRSQLSSRFFRKGCRHGRCCRRRGSQPQRCPSLRGPWSSIPLWSLGTCTLRWSNSDSFLLTSLFDHHSNISRYFLSWSTSSVRRHSHHEDSPRQAPCYLRRQH